MAPAKSEVWKYWDRVGPRKDCKVQCKRCNKIYSTSKNTSNLWSHLKNSHQITRSNQVEASRGHVDLREGSEDEERVDNPDANRVTHLLKKVRIVLKDQYLTMPLSDKKQQAVALTDVPTWKDYFEQDQSRLEHLLAELKGRRGDLKIEHTPIDELSSKVSIFKGDITKLEIDAIVNAANNSLLGGGGVDGAIHRAAGPELLDECKLLNGCKTGQAKLTKGYRLPAKHVIHTVGPKGEKPDLLQSCYEKCLEIALRENLRSVAFPCISTGIYGYPQEAAALIALKTVRTILEKNRDHFDRVVFCTFLPEDVTIYESYLQLFFPTS